jgi:hypothetical protein
VLTPVGLITRECRLRIERFREEGFQFTDFSWKIVFGYACGPEFV